MTRISTRLACVAGLWGLAAGAQAVPLHHSLVQPPAAGTIAPMASAAAPAAAPRITASTTQTLNEPLGLALDRAGNLYVANVNAGITIYNPARHLIGQITAGLSVPTAVAVSSFGHILVANAATRNILVFDSSHNPIGTITDGSIAYPLGMYSDDGDNIYLIDNAGVMHMFLDNGTPIGTLSTGGTAVGPWLSNWSVWGVSTPLNVAAVFQTVSHTLHYGLAVESATGGAPIAAGGIAEDALGAQYITDQANNRVVRIAPDQNSSSTVLSTPSAPYGIAIDAVRKKMYVSFPQTYTIGVYSLAPPYTLLATIH